MALAQTEVAKRKSVKAMLERLEPEVQDSPETALRTRQELFGGYASRAEEGFQQRCLRRMCEQGLLDSMVAVPTRTRVYAVRDSSKVLDALTDDEALTRLIWHRPGIEEVALSSSASEAPEASEGSSVEVVDGGTVASALSDLAADSEEGLQAVTLKLLAGMVESLYYLRTKVESIERKLESLTQGSR